MMDGRASCPPLFVHCKALHHPDTQLQKNLHIGPDRQFILLSQADQVQLSFDFSFCAILQFSELAVPITEKTEKGEFS